MLCGHYYITNNPTILSIKAEIKNKIRNVHWSVESKCNTAAIEVSLLVSKTPFEKYP